METAIKKAISGGYTHYLMSNGEGGQKVIGESKSDVLLDPEFWRCLGRGRGWNKMDKGSIKHFVGNKGMKVAILPTKLEGYILSAEKDNVKVKVEGLGIQTVPYQILRCIEYTKWKIEWHNFIDHLASGKSIDSFFEELLSNQRE